MVGLRSVSDLARLDADTDADAETEAENLNAPTSQQEN